MIRRAVDLSADHRHCKLGIFVPCLHFEGDASVPEVSAESLRGDCGIVRSLFRSFHSAPPDGLYFWPDNLAGLHLASEVQFERGQARTALCSYCDLSFAVDSERLVTRVCLCLVTASLSLCSFCDPLCAAVATTLLVFKWLPSFLLRAHFRQSPTLIN